ncbi:MAG TPA: DNA gyrase inhibitor YacG [Casimicrobiaceae bacterium]|nr:DNA gyrase inhibitor YacG [Casimicrobiaceae bacterium]
MPPKVVPCPRCGKAVEWSPVSRWRPFCSERCKTIDLGAWATESYRIAGEEPTEPEGSEPTPATGRRERAK